MAKDPTVRSDSVVPGYPEGTHPIHPISEQTWNGERFTYSDAPDDVKPDPSSIVQVIEPDPIQEGNDKALRDDAKSGQKQAAAEQKQADKDAKS